MTEISSSPTTSLRSLFRHRSRPADKCISIKELHDDDAGIDMTNYDLRLDDQLLDDEVEELDAMVAGNQSTQPTLTNSGHAVEETQEQGKSSKLTAWVREHYELIHEGESRYGKYKHCCKKFVHKKNYGIETPK